MAFGLRSVRNAGRAADGGMAVQDRRNLDLTLDDDDLMEQEHHDVDLGQGGRNGYLRYAMGIARRLAITISLR
jgi:hypothetical protein